MTLKSKNIHILPTDKPSRLFTSFGKLNIGDYITERKNTHVQNQNIYITSDEEIKEGDWIIYKKFMFPLKVVLDQDGYHIINNGIGEVVGDYYSLQEIYKKIILTTDQDLIKDGVQAIDDEFLEWFVKNPSCERVEVQKGFEDGTSYDYNFLDYKIIIPKEEPKPFKNMLPLTKVDWEKFKKNPIPNKKEETLEEVADNIFENLGYGFTSEKSAFINGYLECVKKMYSEEDMKKAFQDGKDNIDYSETYGCSTLTTEEWFEQFKNK